MLTKLRKSVTGLAVAACMGAAPAIVEAIVDGRHEPTMTLARLLEPFPVAWHWQGGPFS